MTGALTPDICVIGAGSAGLTVAAAARAFEASVVLIEKGEMGGDCLNQGCVPSKSLIAAARHAQAIRDGGRFGVHAGEPRVDFPAVMAHVRSVIAAIAPNDSQERFERLGATVIRAPARFRDAETVEAAGRTIRARRFVIAAGSCARVPDIPGLDGGPFLTNETLFDLDVLPRHLIVIGGGPIGLEMAQAFRRLGSAVTVLEGDRAIGKDDPELAAIVLGRLRTEGIDLREGTKVAGVAWDGGGATVRLEDGAAVAGSHLLVAVGRSPSLEGLDLDRAGIETTDKGIRTDASLRTTNARAYAIGDIAGGPQFTHWAGYQAGLVVRSILFRLTAKQNLDILPWATFTDPELAHVGLSEATARERHGDSIRVFRWPFAENDRAQAERATDGLLKVVTMGNGTVVGAGIVGPHAGELIASHALAVANGLKIGAWTKTVLPYPTLSESAKRTAIDFYRPTVERPLVKRVVGWLSRLG